jgi:hypothetical protein
MMNRMASIETDALTLSVMTIAESWPGLNVDEDILAKLFLVHRLSWPRSSLPGGFGSVIQKVGEGSLVMLIPEYEAEGSECVG